MQDYPFSGSELFPAGWEDWATLLLLGAIVVWGVWLVWREG